jgi:hypothetical protein
VGRYLGVMRDTMWGVMRDFMRGVALRGVFMLDAIYTGRYERVM